MSVLGRQEYSPCQQRRPQSHTNVEQEFSSSHRQEQQSDTSLVSKSLSQSFAAARGIKAKKPMHHGDPHRSHGILPGQHQSQEHGSSRRPLAPNTEQSTSLSKRPSTHDTDIEQRAAKKRLSDEEIETEIAELHILFRQRRDNNLRAQLLPRLLQSRWETLEKKMGQSISQRYLRNPSFTWKLSSWKRTKGCIGERVIKNAGTILAKDDPHESVCRVCFNSRELCIRYCKEMNKFCVVPLPKALRRGM